MRNQGKKAFRASLLKKLEEVRRAIRNNIDVKRNQQRERYLVARLQKLDEN